MRREKLGFLTPKLLHYPLKTLSVLNYFTFDARENLALYIASFIVRSNSFKGSSLFWEVPHRRLINSCRRYGTPYRSYFSRVKQSQMEALSCPKRRYLTTNLGCVTFQRSANLIFAAAKNWHHPSLTITGFNLLNPTDHVMHQQLYVLPTLYLCVLYLSENKQRLVPLTS